MRIGLNLLHVRPEIGGCWNYIENVIAALKYIDCDCEFFAYCTSVSVKILPKDPRLHAKIVNLDNSSQLARISFEQCILPFLARRDKLDCMHWFANNIAVLGMVPSVVTVHDFIFIDMPTEVSFVKRLYLRAMVRFACQKADVLAPISEATAEAAVRLFGVNRKRISVIPNPLQDTFHPCLPEKVNEFRARFKLPSKFWLYVANPAPYKNHAKLFVAYKKLRETTQVTWPLVLRANRIKESEALDRKVVELGIEQSVVWLPRLSSEDMATLYSAATAMIFPSLYEGCGIPLLEAMACGCPVAASDISTTLEFAGDAVLKFDATNVDAIAYAMKQFVIDPALRETCAAKGLIKVLEYSSRKIAVKLQAAYLDAASRRSAIT